ncbi:unnamed protein product [Amoebophrya sp. A25]|nr:unnamed protein product [Amoebophrya sp. A25]|eukprot:GSA25T00003103001.1
MSAFKKTTDEVPDEDYVDDFQLFDISEVIDRPPDKVAPPGSLHKRLNVGDLWSGCAEYFDHMPAGTEEHRYFHQNEPNFVQFNRPLSNLEAAARLESIKSGRKPHQIPQEFDTNIDFCRLTNFLNSSMKGNHTSMKHLPTTLMQQWTKHLQLADDVPIDPNDNDPVQVPPPLYRDMPRSVFQDRKGFDSAMPSLVEEDYMLQSHLDRSKPQNRIEYLRHKLYALEVIQLINLAPESVREARNLIPSLNRIPYETLWFYITRLRDLTIRAPQLESEPSSLQEQAQLMNHSFVSHRIKRKRAGRDVDLTGMTENERMIVGREGRMRAALGADVQKDRAAFNRLLHNRRDMGVADGDLLNPGITPGLDGRKKRRNDGGLTPGGMTPGGATPGGLTPGGMISVGGGLTPGGGIAGATPGVEDGGATPGGATPGFDETPGGMLMGGETPGQMAGAMGNRTPGEGMTPADGALSAGHLTPFGRIADEEVEKFSKPPAGVHLGPSKENLWEGISDKQLTERMVDGVMMPEEEAEARMYQNPALLSNLHHPGDAMAQQRADVEKRKLEKEKAEMEKNKQVDRVAMLRRKWEDPNSEMQIEEMRELQRSIDDKYKALAEGRGMELFRYWFQKGKYIGFREWYADKQNLIWERNRVIKDELIKIKLERQDLGPIDVFRFQTDAEKAANKRTLDADVIQKKIDDMSDWEQQWYWQEAKQVKKGVGKDKTSAPDEISRDYAERLRDLGIQEDPRGEYFQKHEDPAGLGPLIPHDLPGAMAVKRLVEANAKRVQADLLEGGKGKGAGEGAKANSPGKKSPGKGPAQERLLPPE